VTGQVYAQPLISQGTLFVVTEANYLYGLDPQTGAINWSNSFGTPFSASDIGCADLSPDIGITSTPVIDQATNIAYLFSKAYLVDGSGAVAWYAHAVDVASGAEEPGFPVTISGTAANDSTQIFQARTLGQRPGLLLLDGVIYAGFASHCDISPWAGWIVGVSTSGQLATLWTTQAGPQKAVGGGVWQSGGGLVSDGPGQILFSTGNGGSLAGPIAGTSPPATFGEAVVRLSVQADNSLRATDFFSPYDAQMLDGWDGDLGSGAPVALPSQYFGTAQYPDLLVEVGKEGYVYLLNRDNLGGIGTGPSGGDAVVGRIGPYGGVWSKPAVWPGDGGYLYVPTASAGNTAGGSSGSLQVFQYGLDGTGKPTLGSVGQSSDAFGFGSGAPVVTSNGTTSGTALVWTTWTASSSGSGAQLRAYDAVPVGGVPNLRFSASIGSLSKFASPGVAGNCVYVGTGDGHVIGFGAPVSTLLSGSGFDFGAVSIGASSQTTLTVTAASAVALTGVSISAGPFALSTATPALPATLQAGATLSIPVTFAPQSSGMAAATISVAVANSATPFTLSVSGIGASPNGQIYVTPSSLSFGGTTLGMELDETVTLTNIGGAPLTIASETAPAAPFAVTGAPATGAVLAPGAQVTLTVSFNPSATGMYTGSLGFNTTGGAATVQLSGTCSPPGKMTIVPLSLSFGTVGVTQSVTSTFTVANTGGSPITITKSKPPALGVFVASTSLEEGTTLSPGVTLTESVAFSPLQLGSASDQWILNADDGTGLQTVQLSGTGATDITASATIIALITNPTGGGNHNLGVIRDGVYPPVGSSNSATEYDTYTGATRTEDWIGYQYSSTQTFGALTFQDGMQFHDGGWFTTLNVQVLQSGTWVNVPNVTVSPAYKGNDGVNFETYNFSFPAISGTGIRIDGTPGGSATFISVGELRVYQAPGATGPETLVANAGVNQSVTSDGTVTLNGSGSSASSGDALTYAWTQVAGPTVALSSVSAAQPTFVAPTVTTSTALTFSLIVSDGSLSSTAATVTITVVPASSATDAGTDAGGMGTDITATATIIALITNPTGGGNHNLEVIRDGVYPPVGSSNSATEYDTYTGATRTEDWIGYQYSSTQTFGALTFQDGMQFHDGGWFTTLNVQVLQSGTWIDVPNVTVSPAYKGNDGVNFETYNFSFPAISGTGIRIDGTPGGSATFISVGELRVYQAAGSTRPETLVANAGVNQSVTADGTVTLNGSGSSASNGDALTYAWTQIAGPTVPLSSVSAVQPTFVAPTVTTSTALTFSLIVSDGSLSSTAATVTVTVVPASSGTDAGADAGGTGTDITASATIIALITNPTGGGNHNLEVIRDGVYPPVGSSNSATEYDTYTGTTRTEDWIGYQYSSTQTFGALTFQDGMQFHDGGWFTTLNVQVLQSGTWVTVPNVTVSPAYKGNDGVNFETYNFTFPAISGTGIRIDGTPGGSATFISVGELRVYQAAGATGPETLVANAGANQSVTSDGTVTLNGSGSSASNGDALTYDWTQIAGPTVTLSSLSAVQPTFVAPTVTTSTALTFNLIVSDGSLSSTAATVTITVVPASSGTDAGTDAGGMGTDITASATIIALITNPTGGGNHNLEVIRDGVYPPVGSSNSSTEYDTYTGATRTEDWIGYEYSSTQTFGALTYQAGIQFHDGGWFTTLNVQVLQSGTWVTVPNVTVSPAYKGNDGINFETYNFSFPAISGTGIRIDGTPGGSATFISVGELRVYQAL
jgi:iron transport multicopper oxidase